MPSVFEVCPKTQHLLNSEESKLIAVIVTSEITNPNNHIGLLIHNQICLKRLILLMFETLNWGNMKRLLFIGEVVQLEIIEVYISEDDDHPI